MARIIGVDLPRDKRRLGRPLCQLLHNSVHACNGNIVHCAARNIFLRQTRLIGPCDLQIKLTHSFALFIRKINLKRIAQQ